MTTRIYTVSDGTTDRLIRASTRRQALWHVASDVFKTRPSTQTDLETLLLGGTKVEIAGEEPQQSLLDGDEGEAGSQDGNEEGGPVPNPGTADPMNTDPQPEA